MSDELLNKADALIRRKNADARPRIPIPEPAPFLSAPPPLETAPLPDDLSQTAIESGEFDITLSSATPVNETNPATSSFFDEEEDFPVLTDIIEETKPSPHRFHPDPPSSARTRPLDETMIEAWLAERIPQLVANSLAGLEESLIRHITAQLRTELKQRNETSNTLRTHPDAPV